MRFFAWSLVLLIGTVGMVTCAPKHSSSVPTKKKQIPDLGQGPIQVSVPFTDPTWQKRWWIEKAARTLRHGEGLGPKDDLNKLLQMSEEDIAKQFMADARFGDTVLDFNMYFLGFRADSLRDEEGYSPAAFDMPNAVQSAKALLKNEDYLKLLDFDSGYFMPPLRLTGEDDQATGYDPVKERKALYTKMQKLFQKVIQSGKSKPKAAAFCKLVREAGEQFLLLNEQFSQPFDRAEVVFERAEILPEGFDTSSCEPDPSNVDIKEIVQEAEDGLEKFETAFAEIFKHEPKIYSPKTIEQFRPFNLKAIAAKQSGLWIAMSNEQNTALANSSTNMNRKRSAYILKHYFCDDLTPVGFEDPGQHTGGQHGSETSCFACHYKLDPMAGFFRFFGSQFADYSQLPEIIFDDSVTTDRARYEDQWRSRPGTARTWNVGYIRSSDPRFQSKNMYGETLADLTKILRTAPEVKRCMMRRLFEFMVAENQVIDGAYLTELSDKFEQEATANSSVALKNSIVRILLSRSFSEPNPNPQQCYDHGTGGGSGGANSPPNSPPCQVAALLNSYCKNCHSSTSGPGSLDLTAWTLSTDGKHYTFPHEDPNGNPMDRKETFARIADRLSTNDPKKRMPKGGMMPSQERQQLYIWIQGQLAQP